MDVIQSNGALYHAARSGFLVALIAGIATLSAGLGNRYGLWDYRTALGVLKWAAYVGGVAAVLSLAGIIISLQPSMKRGLLLWAVHGLIIGITVSAIPLYWKQKAESVPHIHDITTDTENPPHFKAILPLRRNASNPSDYGGPQVAAQQRQAYPDIAPLDLAITPRAAFGKALAAARKMGWTIIDAEEAGGRIEAVDTTFWFGFRDDIVIRIRGIDNGSRIDIRSVSRVGISDIGANAKRIRKFLTELRKVP